MNPDGGPAWTEVEVESGSATLAAQVTGSREDPTILLVPGATQSRDAWSDGFCATLVESGLRVVRYDPRDTGESTLRPVGDPDYSGADLASDVVAVLDAVGVEDAVIAGMSMGGGVTQAVAAAHPDRVRALVLISTTPGDDADRDLPGPTPAVMATFEDDVDDPDWTDLTAVCAWMVESERPYRGDEFLEEDDLHEATEQTWRRSPSMAPAANHVAVAESGEPIDVHAALDLPTLVVHGAADPLFPLPHGTALADLFGAELLVLDGVGHQVPPRSTWPDVVEAIRTLVATTT